MIARFVRLSALTMMLILIAGGLLAAWRLDRVRMGGAVERQQAQAAELVADILPPPEYVIEPYLEATLLLRDPAHADNHVAAIAQLRKSFDARTAYWQKATLTPELHAIFDKQVLPSAAAFWTEIDTGLLPAVASGDSTSIETSYVRLSEAYRTHRAAIEQLVTAANARQAALESEGSHEFWLAVGIVVVLALIVAAQAAHFYYRMETRALRPLAVLSDLVDRLANGADEPVPYQDHRDELGAVARGLEHYRGAAAEQREIDARNIQEQERVVALLGNGLLALRNGDLTQFLTEELPPNYLVLKDNINDAVGSLRTMIQQVNESAQGIRTGAQEIAAASNNLARRTENSAERLGDAAHALQETRALLDTSTEAAATTAKRADEARSSVDVGRATADRAVQAMTRVSDSAKGIDGVIEGLDKIAFQTRVLAMNAAVEAGRAGEAGRGFMVVADLVSALAHRAEDESQRARELLTTTQEDVVQAAQAVGETDAALVAIAEGVGGVHALIERLLADNRTQAASIAGVSQVIADMDFATKQNAAMVEQTSAATQNLFNEVEAMARQSAEFKFDRRKGDEPVSVERRKAIVKRDIWHTDPATGKRAAIAAALTEVPPPLSAAAGARLH